MLSFSPTLWAAARDILAGIGSYFASPGVVSHLESNEYLHAMVFVVLGAVIEYPVSLGLKIYSTFVIEEEFGFNKHTASSFAGDEAKDFIFMNLFLSALMYMPMIFLVGWAGPNAWYYLWAFLSTFVLLFNIIYPVVIAPLFNKFTPLEDTGAQPSNPDATPRDTVRE